MSVGDVSPMALLFERDPEQLSDQDIDAMIERYRQARAQFNLGVKSAGATKKVVAEAGPQLDLTELGL